METFLTILELTIPSIVVFVVMFFSMKHHAKHCKTSVQPNDNQALEVLKAFIDNESKKRDESRRIENAKITVPLRIQAYERLVLLLERINPESLLLRVQTPQMTAGLLHKELLITVRAEFEHNLSQQIYVSQTAWDSVKFAKDSIVKIINEQASQVADVAPAGALSTAILTCIISLPQNPVYQALAVLKADAENYM